MRYRTSQAGFVFGALLCLQASPVMAGSAPNEIRGKSVTVSWSETREIRPFGEGGDWRKTTNSFKVQLYVSEAGRLFLDGKVDTRAGAASGKAVVASSGKSVAGNFAGRSLTIVHRGTGNIARQLTFEFDAPFQNCTARIVYARLSASGITRDYSPMLKRFEEVRNAEISGAQCGVQTGNVFSER